MAANNKPKHNPYLDEPQEFATLEQDYEGGHWCGTLPGRISHRCVQGGWGVLLHQREEGALANEGRSAFCSLESQRHLNRFLDCRHCMAYSETKMSTSERKSRGSAESESSCGSDAMLTQTTMQRFDQSRLGVRVQRCDQS